MNLVRKAQIEYMPDEERIDTRDGAFAGFADSHCNVDESTAGRGSSTQGIVGRR